MSKKFQVSAPGKIILHGEHSVVYNKPAIAGPIGLRTYFNFEETSEEFIELNYVRLDLYCRMSLTNANLMLSEIDCCDSVQPMDFLQKFRGCKDFILKFVEFGDKNLDSKEEMAIGSTLYILNRILRHEKVKTFKNSFSIKVDSDMSIGAGVGSSASYGVCISAGFFILSQILNGKLDDKKFSEFSFDGNHTILEQISQWAFDSEVIMHEKPSGIDNTICTYGQLIKFIRGQAPQPIKMNGKIDILLVDTKVTRSTSHIVGKVANFRNKYSNVANSIFDAMGHLVNDVVTLFESTKESDEKYQELSLLVSVNNNLLRSIGVSHPRLEKVFHIADSYNFKAKLTGAGGGGCCFVLLPPNYESLENYRKLCEELTANNYQIMTTDIVDGSGVEFRSLN